MQDDRDKEVTPTSSTTPDWRELAAKASQECDPNKLSELVNQLCERLDDIEHCKKQVRSEIAPARSRSRIAK